MPGLRTLVLAAAVAGLSAMPIGVGPLSFGEAAHAQMPGPVARGLGRAGLAGGGLPIEMPRLAQGSARGGPPVGIPVPGGQGFAQGGPPVGIPVPGGQDFAQGGPPVGIPVPGGQGFAGNGLGGSQPGRLAERIGPRDPFAEGLVAGLAPREGLGRGGPFEPGFGDGRFVGADGICPPGLADKGCFPPGAQKFRQGFCPPGLHGFDCVPPGLRIFSGGDFIPAR